MAEKEIVFSKAGDDWGTVTHVFRPGMSDTKIDLGECMPGFNYTIKYYTARERRSVEFGERCLDDD